MYVQNSESIFAFCILPRPAVYISGVKWINRLLLSVIYRAGLKALFHCLLLLSGLNLELLRVISSRERAAALVPDYFCLCKGFYAFCLMRWWGSLLIPEGGDCWDTSPPPLCPLSSAACISTTEFRSVWQAIQPPTPSTQLFFPLLKTHLSVGWGGFSIESKHVKIFQKRNKWSLHGALLPFNRPCRQCYWYLPNFPLSCTMSCL